MTEKDNPGAPASAHGADQDAAAQQLDPFTKSEAGTPARVGLDEVSDLVDCITGSCDAISLSAVKLAPAQRLVRPLGSGNSRRVTALEAAQRPGLAVETILGALLLLSCSGGGE